MGVIVLSLQVNIIDHQVDRPSSLQCECCILSITCFGDIKRFPHCMTFLILGTVTIARAYSVDYQHSFFMKTEIYRNDRSNIRIDSDLPFMSERRLNFGRNVSNN